MAKMIRLKDHPDHKARYVDNKARRSEEVKSERARKLSAELVEEHKGKLKNKNPKNLTQAEKDDLLIACAKALGIIE